MKAREAERLAYCPQGHERHHREPVELPRWEKHDPTDLDEIASWASILLGALAVVVVLGLVALTFWAL